MNAKTPNTLVLSIWTEDCRTAITGIARREDSTLVSDVIRHTGAYIWQCVDEALEEAKLLNMRNLLMACNDKGCAQIFMRPVCIEQPDWSEYRILPRGKKEKIPSGGCEYMWSVIRHTMHYQRWRMVHYEKLVKAKELWSESI